MPRKGTCSICGARGKLTQDHVPPQSVMTPEPIVVRRLADVMEHKEDAEVAGRGFTSRVFQTICSTCNSDRMGSMYDPALARFANALGSWVRAASQLHLSLPTVATVRCEPALVARAVIGHLLAAEPTQRSTDALVEGTLPASMRSYFLSSELALPRDFEIYVWPYPSQQTVIGRGIGHWDMSDGEPVVADTLKFFPVAFAVVSVEERMPHIPAARLRPDRLDTLRDSVDLEIDFKRTPGATWPERPQRKSLVLLNRDRVIQVARDRSSTS